MRHFPRPSPPRGWIWPASDVGEKEGDFAFRQDQCEVIGVFSIQASIPKRMHLWHVWTLLHVQKFLAFFPGQRAGEAGIGQGDQFIQI